MALIPKTERQHRPRREGVGGQAARDAVHRGAAACCAGRGDVAAADPGRGQLPRAGRGQPRPQGTGARAAGQDLRPRGPHPGRQLSLGLLLPAARTGEGPAGRHSADRARTRSAGGADPGHAAPLCQLAEV